MSTSLSTIKVKDNTHTLEVKANDITIDNESLITKVNNKANDSDTVHKTGNETIAGNKTFNDSPTFRKNLRHH